MGRVLDGAVGVIRHKDIVTRDTGVGVVLPSVPLSQVSVVLRPVQGTSLERRPLRATGTPTVTGGPVLTPCETGPFAIETGANSATVRP